MRGQLTEKTQSIAIAFLNRKIDVGELRLYPYIDYCIKNAGVFDLSKVTEEEMKIISILQKEGHIDLENGDHTIWIMCTRNFYDYMQNVLAENYVEHWID